MADDNDPVVDWPPHGGRPWREVWYGLAGPRDGSVAFWYRYTLLSTLAGHREGRLWAALSDREDGETFVTEAVPRAAVRTGTDPFRLAVGSAELTAGSARGSVGEGDPPVAWDLSWDPDDYTFTPLRSRRLTALLARIAGTGKHWSRNEAVRVDGTVTVGDRTLTFDGVPGHQGHTVGADPPASWRWVQCNAFDDPSVALEALEVEGRLSVCLRRDGTVHALNRLHHVAGPRANRTGRGDVGDWRFSAAGDGATLAATVTADRWQRVAYAAPDGTRRYNAHCSVSSVTLRYEAGGASRTLASDAGRAEWVAAEPPVAGEYRPDWDAVLSSTGD